MSKPSDMIPDALKGIVGQQALDDMDKEAIEAENKQKIRDQLIATLVKEFGVLRDEVNLIKTKIGVV